jgi:hypothetical protein
MLFRQEGGLQQIIIIHADNNTFAEKIRKRVLDSVELGTLK